MFDDASRRDVVRRLGAAAGATAVVGGFAGSATAHFPPELAVEVKPGVTPNRINPDSDGFTAVGVLATEEFDPTASPVRYRFGAPELVAEGRGPRSVHHDARDLDGDGREDLLLQFPTDDAELGGEEVAELRWDNDRSSATSSPPSSASSVGNCRRRSSRPSPSISRASWWTDRGPRPSATSSGAPKR